MRCPQVVEWFNSSVQEKRSGKTGRRRRPSPLLRLAVTRRLPVHNAQRTAQMFRVRKSEPRSSVLPSSRKGVKESPPTRAGHGKQSSHVWTCFRNTLPLLRAFAQALIWASRTYLTHTLHPITLPSHTCQMYIEILSRKSLQLGVMWAHSHAHSWRPNWAPFRHHPYPLSPKHPSLINTGPYITFPSHIIPHLRHHPSTPTLTAKTSHVLGEHSPPLCSSSHAYPLAHKHPYVMWLKHTGPSQPTRHNGQAWSSVCRPKTNMPLMFATILASPRLGVCMEWLQMLGQTFSEATGLAHWQNGWMTMSSSEFHASTYLPTTLLVPDGASRLVSKEVANTREAAYGTGGKPSQMAPQRSSMRIAASHSRTWQERPHVVRKTSAFPTQTQTLMPSPNTWEFVGNPPNSFPLDQNFLTWVSSGTYTHAQSAYSRRKGSNMWPRLRNGKRSQHTSYRRHRNCMENSNMRPWSYFQGALTSPAWRPCSPLAIIALSYHAPPLETQQVTWNGGSDGSANQIAPDPSQNPNPSSTTGLTQMQAPKSGSRSQLAQGGGHGAWPLDGSRKAETSNGQKLLDSSSSSSTFYHFPMRATTSQYMATTEAWLRGGGTDPATTSQPTGSSGAFSSYQKAMAGRYTRGMSQVPKIPPTPPREATTPPTDSSSTTSMSQASWAPSSSASGPSELARRAVLKRLLPALHPHQVNLSFS